MGNLDRFHSHFYNWYSTRELCPLQPLYVSTVDSGNLAGHLMTLMWGIEEVLGCKVLSPQAFRGLEDTLLLLIEAAREAAVSEGRPWPGAGRVASIRGGKGPFVVQGSL